MARRFGGVDGVSYQDDCRRKSEDLLSAAAQAANMKDRSRLIDEAAYWHNQALEEDEPEADKPQDGGAGTA
jgi:hypothetical protein